MTRSAPVNSDSQGRCGTRFLTTYDRRFVIKTVSSEDVAEMHNILKKYHQVWRVPSPGRSGRVARGSGEAWACLCLQGKLAGFSLGHLTSGERDFWSLGFQRKPRGGSWLRTPHAGPFIFPTQPDGSPASAPPLRPLCALRLAHPARRRRGRTYLGGAETPLKSQTRFQWPPSSGKLGGLCAACSAPPSALPAGGGGGRCPVQVQDFTGPI